MSEPIEPTEFEREGHGQLIRRIDPDVPFFPGRCEICGHSWGEEENCGECPGKPGPVNP